MLPFFASLVASGIDLVLEAATTLYTSKVLSPEHWLQQEARNRLKEDTAPRPDEMHIHLLGDKYVLRRQELVVQWPWRHGPTRNP